MSKSLKPLRMKAQFQIGVGAGEWEDAIAVNPGGWFGKAWVIQVAIANALNPFVVIEADTFSDAIDTLADSKEWGHLINDEDYSPPDGDDDGEDWHDRAGNDSHYVNLDNVVAVNNVADVRYVLELDIEMVKTGAGNSLVCEVMTAIENFNSEKY